MSFFFQQAVLKIAEAQRHSVRFCYLQTLPVKIAIVFRNIRLYLASFSHRFHIMAYNLHFNCFGLGMPEMLKPTSLIMGAGLGLDVACLTDGRFSGGCVTSCYLIFVIVPISDPSFLLFLSPISHDRKLTNSRL